MYHNFIALIVKVVIRKLTTLVPKNSSLIEMTLLGKNSLEERDINFCIKSASTYEDFLLLMKVKGYEIKMESFNAHSTALWKHTLLHPVFVHRSKDVTGTDTYIISPL